MARDAIAIVLKNIGLLLRYAAALPLFLLPVTLWYSEWDALAGVVATSAVFLLVGLALGALRADRDPRLREGLIIAALGWLLVPLGSMLLFILVEGARFEDAYFESMSAWTGTGMSVLDVAALSRTALAWRTLMQWIGGLGVIVLTLAILARPGTGAYTLYASEAREEKLRPSVLSTVRTLWRIYAGLSVAAILLLLAVGLSPWQAVNHALSAICTGGMSVNPGGVNDLANPAAEWALVAIMIAGALPFVVHYAILRGRWRTPWRDEQVRAFVIVLAIALPVILWTIGSSRGDFFPHVRETVFQGVSALTSAGLQTTDFHDWSPASKVAMMGLMLLGGAAGSTAGGIKLVRGALLVKGAFWKLDRSGLPHFAVTSFRFGGRTLTQREANEEFAEAAFIGVLWVVMLLAGLLVLFAIMPSGYEPLDVMFDLASTQGNTGLSTGFVGPHLAWDVKMTLAVVMWAGRLEFLPVLLLLRSILPGSGKR